MSAKVYKYFNKTKKIKIFLSSTLVPKRFSLLILWLLLVYYGN